MDKDYDENHTPQNTDHSEENSSNDKVDELNETNEDKEDTVGSQEQMDRREMQQTTERQETNAHQKQQIHSNNTKKRSKKSGGFFKMLAAAILGSVLTLGTVTQLDYFQPDEDVSEEQSTPVDNDQSDDHTAQPVATDGSIADIVDHASDAIVGIVNMSDQQNPFTQSSDEVESGVGSGVVYKKTDDGAYIVTNNHVIEDASSLQVSLANGDTVDGEVVGTDPLTDIAVVEIKGDYDIKPVDFGDSDKLRTGDSVIAIGNPLGLDLSRTVTQGIVSATSRSIPVETSAGEWEFDVIQTDAAINPGNSGGALLNSQGELVGINTLKIGDNGVEGLGFSIPSNEVKQLIEELVENGKIVRPYAGVGLRSVQEIPPHYLESLPDEVEEGAVVLSVDGQSSAAEAGIEVEDVIVSIGGEEVTNDNDFRKYLYKNASVDDTVEIELYHDGELKTIELTLTSNEDVQ